MADLALSQISSESNARDYQLADSNFAIGSATPTRRGLLAGQGEMVIRDTSDARSCSVKKELLFFFFFFFDPSFWPILPALPPLLLHRHPSAISKNHRFCIMTLFNSLLALAVGVALSHALVYPYKGKPVPPYEGKFFCDDSHWLESPPCCKVSAEFHDECEPCITDHPSANPWLQQCKNQD